MYSETAVKTIGHDSLTQVGFALRSAGTSSVDEPAIVVVATEFVARISFLAFSNEARTLASVSSFSIFARPVNVSSAQLWRPCRTDQGTQTVKFLRRSCSRSALLSSSFVDTLLRKVITHACGSNKTGPPKNLIKGEFHVGAIAVSVTSRVEYGTYGTLRVVHRVRLQMWHYWDVIFQSVMLAVSIRWVRIRQLWLGGGTNTYGQLTRTPTSPNSRRNIRAVRHHADHTGAGGADHFRVLRAQALKRCNQSSALRPFVREYLCSI